MQKDKLEGSLHVRVRVGGFCGYGWVYANVSVCDVKNGLAKEAGLWFLLFFYERSKQVTQTKKEQQTNKDSILV